MIKNQRFGDFQHLIFHPITKQGLQSAKSRPIIVRNCPKLWPLILKKCKGITFLRPFSWPIGLAYSPLKSGHLGKMSLLTLNLPIRQLKVLITRPILWNQPDLGESARSRGHSMTMWTRKGDRWSKNCQFLKLFTSFSTIFWDIILGWY